MILYLIGLFSNLSSLLWGMGIFFSTISVFWPVETKIWCSISVNLLFWSHVISGAFWDGIVFVGISRWFTDISKRILFWSSHSSLDRFRTWVHAFWKLLGLELQGYHHPFISCIVLKITFRLLFFTKRKNFLYCSSNIQSATCLAE